MNKFKTSLKLAIMRSSYNVKTAKTAPNNLLVAYYISRALPFNYADTLGENGVTDNVALNNAWEGLMPSAKALAKEMEKYVPFGTERVLHYAKKFFEFRARYSANVWYNIFQVFGYGIFNGNTGDETIDGTLIDEQQKMAIIISVSTAFEKNRSLMRSNGYVSSEIIYESFLEDQEKYQITNRNVKKVSNKIGYKFIKLCTRIQMWTMGHNKYLTADFTPFLKEMFDYVEKDCLPDNSVIDFVLEHSQYPVETGQEKEASALSGIINIVE